MKTKVIVDNLDKNSVSIKEQSYTSIAGVEYLVGLPHRKAYINSTEGRLNIERDLPNEYKNAVFSVWGDEPTVFDDVE